MPRQSTSPNEVFVMRGRCVVVLVAILAGASVPRAQVQGRGPRTGVVTAQKEKKDPFSKADGNCQDCRGGEAMAQSVMVVPPGVYVDMDNPPCGDARFNSPSIPYELKAVAATAFRTQGATGQSSTFALGFDDKTIAGLERARVNGAGTVAQLTRAITRQPQVASCVRALVVLPTTVKITRIDARMDCPAGGWCRNEQPTREPLDKDLVAVSSVGKNWSHNTTATMILRVFYLR